MGRGHRRGRRGEEIAVRFFSERGWEVLDRNWREGHAELDLVVRRGPVVAIVEVKARSQKGAGDPLESVTRSKRREIERAAAGWLRSRSPELRGVGTIRFDAVSVELMPGRPPAVRHVPDAWRVGDP